MKVEVTVLVPNSPYGLCGRKATLNLKALRTEFRSFVKVEMGALVTPSLLCLCGRKATLHVNLKVLCSEFRSCVKVGVAVLVSPSLMVRYGLCGRKATLSMKAGGGKPVWPSSKGVGW